MAEWQQKRFWTNATIMPSGDHWSVALDGRLVKTPAKAPLSVPTERLARAIADEWAAQGEVIDPLSMPFTRTANAAIDKVAPQFAQVADMLAGYGDSDLICYRADAPEALVERQTKTWDPYLDWAGQELGAQLKPVTGVMHQSQPADSLDVLCQNVHQLTTFELAAFHDLVGLSGSLVLGFAAAYDYVELPKIWADSRVDEIWQEEQWGLDDDATHAAEIKKSAFFHAKSFFDCCQ